MTDRTGSHLLPLKNSSALSLRRQCELLLRDDSGQDLIEYALLAALIGLTAASSMRGLSNKISNAFNSIGTNLANDV